MKMVNIKKLFIVDSVITCGDIVEVTKTIATNTVST